MTATESRALWSGVSQEQIEQMERVLERFFTGKNPEPQITEPEPELPFSSEDTTGDKP